MFSRASSSLKKSNRPLLWSSPTSMPTQERSLTQFTKTVLLSASLKCHALMLRLQTDFTVSTSHSHSSVNWVPSCKVMFALAWKSWLKVLLTNGETSLDLLTQSKLKCKPPAPLEPLMAPIACVMQCTVLIQLKKKLPKLIYSSEEKCPPPPSSLTAHAASSSLT